jgi:formylmethanofuran dehydrogenase subunit B
MEIIATCPACGLMCDDVPINVQMNTTSSSCKKAVNFFNNALSANKVQPLINGHPSDVDQAIAQAAAIFNNSQQPLFSGLGTEVKGMRAIIDLAKKTNATLDHMHSEGTVNNTLSIQNIGYQTTTMTEVKNRADVILVIGTEMSESHPAFFEKLVWNKESMFEKPTPEVMYVGLPKETPSDNLQSSTSPDGKAPLVVNSEQSHLPELMNVLHALVSSKSPLHKKSDDTLIAGVTLNTLKKVVATMQAAQYGVVVWSTSSLKSIPHSELVIQSIIQFINKLNETNRVAGLPLNSGDGDTTVNNTSTWVTGYPTRNRFVNGKPSFDARAFSTENQLSQCDSLLWVSSFNPITPPSCGAPTVAIGHPNTQFETMPDVFIPVAVPGVHASGTMFRMDSSVTLPLKKLAESELPTLASVLKRIEGLLA